MRLSLRVDGKSFRFRDLNDLLAKANRERSGDRLARLAARSAQERVAARRLLAEVTLAELRARPALPPERDAVSRVVDEGLDEQVFRRVRGLTVGELRDHVLGAPPSELTAARLGGGLTPEMAAAVAKLCSNLDLVAGAARIPVVTRANTTLGLPGRLGVRLQPNHPTDDVDEILAQTAEGLSFGCGDALIGVNRRATTRRSCASCCSRSTGSCASIACPRRPACWRTSRRRCACSTAAARATRSRSPWG
jgi:ethanolamine ammonia-lyase large subunit